MFCVFAQTRISGTTCKAASVRDQYFSDYDLWANPLNPPPPPAPGGSSPSIPILTSPHAFDTTRRMT